MVNTNPQRAHDVGAVGFIVDDDERALVVAKYDNAPESVVSAIPS